MRFGFKRGYFRSAIPVLGATLLLGACSVTSPSREPGSAARTALFDGTETFLPDLSPLPQWTAVLARYDRALRSGALAPVEWSRLVAELSGLGFRKKIERANAGINRYPYVPSQLNWGRPDYWETPAEFLVKYGQCQDYAVTKYFLLRAAGVPADRLRVVVVRDLRTRSAHAVLVTDPHGERLLLDNQIRRVVPFATVHRYQPLYALNEEGWWLFKARPAPGSNHHFAQMTD